MTTGAMRVLIVGWALATANLPARADAAALGLTGIQLAQTGLSPPSGPSYGYQPYDDHNPTGLYHPDGMGHGSYYLTPKYHGHRIPALDHRKFRGN